MISRKLLYISMLLVSCSGKLEQQSNADNLAVDSTTILSTSETPITNTPIIETETETEIKNFYGLLPDALTADERETKIWSVLQPLIAQYDTTEFNTISKNYTMPGTEETEYGTQNTSTTVTVILYYDDGQKLKAVWREYSYEEGDSFDKTSSLYLFDEDLIAVYEDGEKAVDIAIQNYTRGIASACPECGVTISSGSGSEPVVSGSLSTKDFASLAKTARGEESLLAYAYADSFQSNGNEYIYQTVEPLSEEADYDVFYTASKSYYEKFMKPKLDK